ncbi:hypothetical protein JXA12_03220 [Candidatus Woesearchaeota archaeon]|nr:hypothetical protein [Candidatus Woesearchaeota archaeon]
MTVERPRPPSHPMKEQDEVAALRDDVRRLREDVAFLRRLLGHLKEEFERLRR